ncbi:MAG TPA: rhodanese-like domain-containing protein, partial [Gaiellaceae bacterium]
AGLETGSTPAIDVPTLAKRLKAGEVRLLDVREDDEWQQGHVEGSRHVPYYELGENAPSKIDDALDGKPLAVACSAGNRSSIAASLLQRDNVENLIHVTDGGVADLEAEGIELVAEEG